MGDLSKHFSRSEFACKCGCGFNTVDKELLELVELVRELNGNVPLTPNSGCRCTNYNRRVGGGTKSQHLYGRAADLPVRDPKTVYSQLTRIYPDTMGFGLYSKFIHVDCRTFGPARWDDTQ